jgi:predicted phosphoribosyltransferase
MHNPSDPRPYFGKQEPEYAEGGPFGKPPPYEIMMGQFGVSPGPVVSQDAPRGPVFRNRRHAGQLLAERLARYRGRNDVLVLGLPRGGVPAAYEVAKSLCAPLDVFMVRKLGVPGHEELAMGAVASGDLQVLNEDVVNSLEIPEEIIEAAARRQLEELKRQQEAYRGGRAPPNIDWRIVILVDDGLATGSSMRAAVGAIKRQRPKRLVVAVPIGAAATCQELQGEVDEVVCVATPADFMAVGVWYEDFTPISDEEVRYLLSDPEVNRPETSA